jgi:hypothetical protein
MLILDSSFVRGFFAVLLLPRSEFFCLLVPRSEFFCLLVPMLEFFCLLVPRSEFFRSLVAEGAKSLTDDPRCRKDGLSDLRVVAVSVDTGFTASLFRRRDPFCTTFFHAFVVLSTASWNISHFMFLIESIRCCFSLRTSSALSTISDKEYPLQTSLYKS